MDLRDREEELVLGNVIRGCYVRVHEHRNRDIGSGAYICAIMYR
jgi:hypothetical protein